MIPNPDTITRSSAICFPMLGNLVINPLASVTVFGHEIYWYGILIALAFLLAMLWCVRHAGAADKACQNAGDAP